MPVTNIQISKNIGKNIDDGLRAITAGLAQLVKRYNGRKSKIMTSDEKKLLNIVEEEISVVLNALKSLGIKIPHTAGMKGLNEALDLAVQAEEIWGENKRSDVIDADDIEKIAILLNSVKTRLGFSTSLGQWL